jgi:hypothetical protein
MSESLYQIAADLDQLMQMYEEAEEEGDSVALKAIDVALTEWCNHKEPAKVDSYAALIRRETAEADLCREEAERLMARVRAKEAHVKRLKDNALRVMQQFNIKELRTPTNSIKRVVNGGLQPLEVDENNLPNGYFKKVEIVSPDTEKIRTALKQGAVVPGAFLKERGEHVRLS